MRKENETFTFSVDCKKAILCENRDIANNFKSWLENQHSNLADFVSFLNRIGIDTPVKLTNSDSKHENSEIILNCLCINSGKSVTLSLDWSEIAVIIGEQTDFYCLDTGFKWSHRIIKRDNITVEDWPVPRNHAATRDVFIGEQYTLSVEFRFYKNTPEETVYKNMDKIDVFLLTLADYSDIHYIYNSVSQYLCLDDAITECEEVLISYNEKLDYVVAPMSMPISEMQNYIVETNFYGIPRERIHYKDGKCIEVSTSKYGMTTHAIYDGTIHMLDNSSSISVNIKTGYFCIMDFGKLDNIVAASNFGSSYSSMYKLLELSSKLVPMVDFNFVPTSKEPLLSFERESIKIKNLTLEYEQHSHSISWYLHIGKQYMLVVSFCFYKNVPDDIIYQNKEKIDKFLLSIENHSDIQYIYNKVSELFGLTNAVEECAEVLISYNEYLEHVPVPMAMPQYLINGAVLSAIFYGMPREKLHYKNGKSIEFASSKNDWTGHIFSNGVTYFLSSTRYLSFNQKLGYACRADFGILNNFSESDTPFNSSDFQHLFFKVDFEF